VPTPAWAPEHRYTLSHQCQQKIEAVAGVGHHGERTDTHPRGQGPEDLVTLSGREGDGWCIGVANISCRLEPPEEVETPPEAPAEMLMVELMFETVTN
jgi:hypothetical protein